MIIYAGGTTRQVDVVDEVKEENRRKECVKKKNVKKKDAE